eukprot:2817356-Rhodomonas_salina.2
MQLCDAQYRPTVWCYGKDRVGTTAYAMSGTELALQAQAATAAIDSATVILCNVRQWYSTLLSAYAMRSTDLFYAATRYAAHSQVATPYVVGPYGLCCYAIPDTGIDSAAPRRLLRDIQYCHSLCCYATLSADIAHAASQCPVLT